MEPHQSEEKEEIDLDFLLIPQSFYDLANAPAASSSASKTSVTQPINVPAPLPAPATPAAAGPLKSPPGFWERMAANQHRNMYIGLPLLLQQ
jgi:hypothetical protein